MSILKVKNIYEFEIAKFMYSFYHGLLPENFSNYFKSANTQHSYNIRTVASDGYYLERVNTKSGLLSCIYEGVKVWNKKAKNLRNYPNILFANISKGQ